MKRILLVKLTSLGDLIHALPSLSDAKSAFPMIQFDWVIDENFAEIALLHPAVRRVFKTNHRNWRKNVVKSFQPVSQLVKEIRENRYDLVIDGQGNFKSASLALFAKGVRAGFDRMSVRETIAQFVYHKKYSASWKIHAIDRLRTLFSKALGYALPEGPPNFGLMKERFVRPVMELPEEFLVFVHSATWSTKLWPEEYWKKLIQLCDLPILLPWGTEMERERAERLANGNPKAFVLSKLSLLEIGFVLEKARGCVSIDTGLSHLAAALAVPTVTIYGSTDAGLIGTSGEHQVHLMSNRFCSPCHQKKCSHPNGDLFPPCTAKISPEVVCKQINLICRDTVN